MKILNFFAKSWLPRPAQPDNCAVGSQLSVFSAENFIQSGFESSQEGVENAKKFLFQVQKLPVKK